MRPGITLLIAAVCALVPTALVIVWISSAADRLSEAATVAADPDSKVAVASASDETYCTPDLKRILRRVLQSCGLIGASGGRGCQPLEAKNVATMSGQDFNALFRPMAKRGGIIQFDKDSAELDAQDTAVIDRVFSNQAGASYFFVVSRASPEGAVEHNRELSKKRAENVMSHLRTTFQDPDLEKEVGLLWLGEEFAQLDQEFCNWERSGVQGECGTQELNRSAFVAWIECRL